MERFITTYQACLTEIVQADQNEPPSERRYYYGVDAVPDVVARMKPSFATGNFDINTPAIRLVCKRLGIPRTYKAIARFIANHV